MFKKLVLLIFGIPIIFGHSGFEHNLLKTWKNKTFYAFRGIKYAEPPTGALRFKAPQPAKTWNNITAILEQELGKDGSDCPSPNTSYDEDCLYLNVYTKYLNESSLKPVIVNIHPGGFYVGSGSSANSGPEYLMEEDIVLVTFNYRLAFFGFTAIGSTDAIGNAGFKDQALVLRWVQDHILHFGGDPNCVTLMGDSAGGMSVALHMVSPLSRHLFHRVFAMSGGILPQSKSPSSQPHLIAKLAQLIGCSDDQNAFECVRNAPTEPITNSLRKIFEFGWDNPVFPWLPIVEPKHGDEAPFLDEDPMTLLETGQFNSIPVMVSVTKDETASSGMYLFEHRELLTEWVNDFSRVGPICMQYKANETVSEAMRRRYADFQIDDRENLVDSFVRTAEGFADATINFPVYRFAQLLKRTNDVHYIKFNFHGQYSVFKCNTTIDKELCDEIKKLKIVEHLDDLQYIFTSSSVPRITDEFSDEGQTVHKFTKLVSSFAKTGHPYFGPNIAMEEAKFKSDEKYVIFDSTFQIDKKPFPNSAIWDTFFPVKSHTKRAPKVPIKF